MKRANRKHMRLFTRRRRSPNCSESVCAKNGRGSHPRRGSLYVAVLMVGAVVSVLGLSALLVGRINNRSHSGLADMTAARMNAQSAIRLGMLKIENDPDWRFTEKSDEWFVDVPLGSGTFSLTVTDPSDGDVFDAAADPLVLTGTGKAGEAVHRTEITLAPLHRGYDCLKSAVHAGDDIRFYTAQASADHLMSANDEISASSSVVNADVAAGDNVSGWSFTQTIESGAEIRSLPDPDDVLSFYESNGTWIELSDIPGQFADVVRNGGFEDGASFWEANNSVVIADDVTAHSGDNSLAVTGRYDDLSGVKQDVKNLLLSGRTYDIDIAASCSEAIVLYVHLEVEDLYGLDDHVSAPIHIPAGGAWTTATVQIQPWFEEPLTTAELTINTSAYGSFDSGGGSFEMADPAATPPDFRVDSVEMREQGSVLAIDQVLLSPQSNPFGATNPQGIYLIDLRGNRLVVRNSRVHGTLVLIDPSSSTELGDRGSLAMSPADSNLPTLIVSGNQIYINPSERGLSENAMQVNLNPPDAPWKTVGSDADMTDTFSSGIDGMVYSSHRLRISRLTMAGTIISNDDVFIEDDFSITYDNRFYRNPPPGFSGPEQIRILLGSARRVTE